MSRACCRLRIARIRSGESAEHRSPIGKRTTVRAHGVLRVRDRHDAGATRQANRRLDAGDTALPRRAHDRAVGLRRERGGRERGRDGGSGTGARAARIAIEYVRIAALAADAAPAARALEAAEVRPLAQVRLADDHRACVAQPLRDRRILERRRADQRQRARSRLLSIAGVDVVLQQDRDAVQRAARPVAPLLIELQRCDAHRDSAE